MITKRLIDGSVVGQVSVATSNVVAAVKQNTSSCETIDPDDDDDSSGFSFGTQSL